MSDENKTRPDCQVKSGDRSFYFLETKEFVVR